MKKIYHRLFLIVATTGLSLWCAALEPDRFIAPDAIDGPALLASPPAPDSIAETAERETMHNLQTLRSPALVQLALRYDTIDVFALLRPVLGDWCEAAALPLTAEVFSRVHREIDPCIDRTKTRWNRPRPYMVDDAIVPSVYRPVNTSYPSGHSVVAETFAILLTVALPEHGPEWNEQSALVRWSRVVGGAHYPSDTVAGRILGQALGTKLLESTGLRAALVQVRREINSAAASNTRAPSARKP